MAKALVQQAVSLSLADGPAPRACYYSAAMGEEEGQEWGEEVESWIKSASTGTGAGPGLL